MHVNPDRLDFTEKDFDECVVELKALLFQRGEQYNNKSQIFDYFPFGRVSFDQMLWVKTLREINNEDPKNFDSIQDLINYAFFKWVYFKKQLPLPPIEKESQYPVIPKFRMPKEE